ncbi:hypothetical protein TPDSL_09120 [Terrisporobacter petrolearius]|uniref:hypothetical protein n=1 Tax=Terrisporobacter petrolearius TaxID=1460447 RepID=UPI0008E28101|nr:hypothetical protein SAMN02910355_3611 [Terrisporobacter glycolicus]
MIIKKLFVIIDEMPRVNISKRGNEINDLLTFIPIENLGQRFLYNFTNIYDASKLNPYDKKKLILNKVLDFSLGKGYLNKLLNYNFICMYENGKLEKHTVSAAIDEGYDLCRCNVWYGHGNAIKNYGEYKGSSYLAIEHGVYLTGYTPKDQINDKYTGIITFGDAGYERLKNETKQDIIRIGPYINYANVLYPNKFMQYIKKILGKTLLIFPSHSTWSLQVDYDIDKFINYIKNVVLDNKIQSVIVCMFSRDIERGTNKYFEDNGFIVVTCGYRGDINFLNKQKTLINLADYVISNIAGTYLGYCIYLEKPITLYDQEINRKLIKEDPTTECKFDWRLIDEFYTNQQKIITQEFCEFNQHITKKQYNIANTHWGFNYIKTRKEMKDILNYYNNKT